jgi:putative hemolysin
MNIARFAAAALAAAVLVATAAGSARAVTPASHTIAPAFGAPALATTVPDSVAGQYCRATGGEVIRRIPESGTNNPKPLVLSGSADFCQYLSKGKNSSGIHVLLSTLVATLPTLAALAYYAEVKFDEKTCPDGANPGSCYCTQLGGSDLFGGVNAGGGAWVGRGPYADLDACIFPDMSSIDSLGLFYHSANEIRGINLAKVLKFKNPFKH